MELDKYCVVCLVLSPSAGVRVHDAGDIFRAPEPHAFAPSEFRVRGVRVKGLGFGVWGLGFRDWGSGSRVWVIRV